MVPELSLERRETVWILPGVRKRCSEETITLYERTGDAYPMVISCLAEGTAEKLRCNRINAESISSVNLSLRQLHPTSCTTSMWIGVRCALCKQICMYTLKTKERQTPIHFN